jgi:hypothetical protein
MLAFEHVKKLTARKKVRGRVPLILCASVNLVFMVRRLRASVGKQTCCRCVFTASCGRCLRVATVLSSDLTIVPSSLQQHKASLKQLKKAQGKDLKMHRKSIKSESKTLVKTLTKEIKPLQKQLARGMR